jgi:Trypsin-like peptidase domain
MRFRILSIVFVCLSLGLLPQTIVKARQTGGLSASDIYKQSSPSVVLIETYNEKGQVMASGSGFIVNASGAILTNFHVVEHTKRATVRLANDDAYDTVEVLDVDKRKDIALIKIKGIGLPAVRLGRSNAVEVGDKVFSLSNPLGLLQNTLSEGIVSGIRQLDGYKCFQITAPISHGSSGGPIFNSKGEVIGLAVATIEEGQNLNLAVPIDYALGMLDSTQARPLESIYEPAPPQSPAVAETGNKTDARSAPAGPANPTPRVSEEMKKASFVYLGTKIGKWNQADAETELGPPLRHRFAYDQNQQITGDIYAYSDPTKALREFELDYDVKTKLISNLYGFPWDMSWEQCKSLWGENASLKRNANGTKFYLYRDRKLNVLLDKSGKVISLGVY